MVSITKLMKKPDQIGRLWLTGVRPAYQYVNGTRTDVITGYRYDLVAIDMDAETFSVKIPGDQLMESPNGHVEVMLIHPEWIVYSMNNRVQVSAKAEGIKAVQKS